MRFIFLSLISKRIKTLLLPDEGKQKKNPFYVNARKKKLKQFYFNKKK